MNRLVLLLIFLVVATALSSCEGSFGPKADTLLEGGTPDGRSENVWYHHAYSLSIRGIIQPIYSSASLFPISSDMRVMVGWEARINSDPKLIFTGSTAPYLDIYSINGGSGYDSAITFQLDIPDSILQSVLQLDSRTGNIAIGHLFLVKDSRIVERSIVSYSQLIDYDIQGASDMNVIAFKENTPFLRGVPLDDFISSDGYNVFYSVSNNPSDPYRVDAFFNVTTLPSVMAMFADTDRAAIKSRNPLWLY